MNKGVYVGLGTFCILICLFVLIKLPQSFLNGILGSAFGGLGIAFLYVGLEGKK